MRNDFYIYTGFPHEWKNEFKVGDGNHEVICDAWFKKDGRYHYLEVDSIQKMSENRKKIERYLALLKGGIIKEHFGYFPTLVWVTTSELRRKRLQELCKDLPCQVYTIDEIR
jgi:hypothetical protein